MWSGVFSAAFAVRRAVQRDAQARLAAYRAAHHERAVAGPAAVRDRLGLTLPGLERAARRAAAAGLSRRGGVDVNVSNLAVVSIPTTGVAADGLRATCVARSGPDADRLAAERLRQRRRNRALQRSRRAANPHQYQLSARQQHRADRRRAAGPPPVTVTTPTGPRIATAAGVPVQAYRRDQLSAGYRRLRAQTAADGAARTRAGRTRAQIVAATIVATHGAELVIEAADLRAWAARWGRGLHAFTPGMLVAALRHETSKVAALGGGAGLVRAGTRHTAWTQHCLCGTRTPKQLRHRRHHCTTCGLAGGRDLMAALVCRVGLTANLDDAVNRAQT
ncbi:hypothetical protein GCM10022255_104440 [Dactylosporangium darangshiense]|uniref:Transposase n=2 Tax=Dactylosporangium darangshiense TaxID=579108 RepID=A0ABP8DST4_9ACTN